MGKKIAVHCPTRELWNKVQIKAFSSGKEWSSYGKKTLDFWHDDAEETCINMYSGCLERHNRGYYSGKGYTIISAADYLKEGEVEEFKVGDRVRYTGNGMVGHFQKNEIYTVSRSWSKYLRVSELEARNADHSEYKSNFIKLTNKSKENKDMNINSSIRTVFVEEDKADFDLVEKMQKIFGGEIKEDFTGAMILRNNKEEYLAEIKRLDDIEAKRLKEEAKK